MRKRECVIESIRLLSLMKKKKKKKKKKKRWSN